MASKIQSASGNALVPSEGCLICKKVTIESKAVNHSFVYPRPVRDDELVYLRCNDSKPHETPLHFKCLKEWAKSHSSCPLNICSEFRPTFLYPHEFADMQSSKSEKKSSSAAKAVFSQFKPRKK